MKRFLALLTMLVLVAGPAFAQQETSNGDGGQQQQSSQDQSSNSDGGNGNSNGASNASNGDGQMQQGGGASHLTADVVGPAGTSCISGDCFKFTPLGNGACDSLAGGDQPCIWSHGSQPVQNSVSQPVRASQ